MRPDRLEALSRLREMLVASLALADQADDLVTGAYLTMAIARVDAALAGEVRH